jgi:hypothetical protein
MKKNKIFKLLISGIISLLLVLSTINVVNSEIIENNISEKKIKIRIYDSQKGVLSENLINIDIYKDLFDLTYEELNDESFMEIVTNKIDLLVDSGCINSDQASHLIKQYEIFEKQNNLKYPNSLIGLFDVVNIFNGIFFKLDGEKVNSFLDLYVLNLPILNKNISALFSFLTEVQGKGFVFTLGVLGFQSIFNFSLVKEERFSDVEGSIYGFTGILIETIGGDITQDKTIMGIGMNIFTYWNET